VGQRISEIRGSPQLTHGESGNQAAIQRLGRGIWSLCSTGVRKWGGRLFLAALTLPVAIGMILPHAVAAVIASIMVAGIAGVTAIIRTFLFHYAKNSRADLMFDICQATIDRKISPSDAEKLIRAVHAPDSPQQ
jgi:hypothetical protein